MKTNIIMAMGLVTVMSVAAYYQLGGDVEVINDKTETVIQTETVEVEALDVRIKDAQDAAREEIETAAQSAYDAVYEEKMQEVSDSVKTQYIAEIEATISSEDY